MIRKTGRVKRWGRVRDRGPIVFETFSKNANIRRVGWRRCEVAYLNILLYIPGRPIGQCNAALISTHGVEQWPKVGRSLKAGRRYRFLRAFDPFSFRSPTAPFLSSRDAFTSSVSKEKMEDCWKLDIRGINWGIILWVGIMGWDKLSFYCFKYKDIYIEREWYKLGYCFRRWMFVRILNE